ncbi:MAG TPA: hypothetical protein DEA08_03640 [Planctomycetes bacterium]|nr:hypothetical protein [Planctomycetota bacterium]
MKTVARTLALISVLLLALFALPFALADDGERATRARQAPSLGERAPLASISLADLEGRPVTLASAQGKERFLVLHVFDVDDLDLVPGPDHYDEADAARAARRGGSLSPARAPETWTLDDCVEQAHRRFDREGELSWVGVPTWDAPAKLTPSDLEERADSADAEPLLDGRRKVLGMHLKRRERYDHLLRAPRLQALVRVGVRRVPCVLIVDPAGEVVFRWERYDADDETNYLIRALLDVTGGDPIATPRGGPPAE